MVPLAYDFWQVRILVRREPRSLLYKARAAVVALLRVMYGAANAGRVSFPAADMNRPGPGMGTSLGGSSPVVTFALAVRCQRSATFVPLQFNRTFVANLSKGFSLPTPLWDADSLKIILGAYSPYCVSPGHRVSSTVLLGVFTSFGIHGIAEGGKGLRPYPDVPLG
jgi:hypothetical protein